MEVTLPIRIFVQPLPLPQGEKLNNGLKDDFPLLFFKAVCIEQKGYLQSH